MRILSEIDFQKVLFSLLIKYSVSIRLRICKVLKKIQQMAEPFIMFVRSDWFPF